jgi:F-type H+-transporting ATPase subunit epsilon
MLYLEIISPEKLLFAGEITIIKLPGVSGSFEIMKNHVPIISTLKQGKIKVKETSGIVSYFDVEGGLVEASNNEVKVLVE